MIITYITMYKSDFTEDAWNRLCTAFGFDKNITSVNINANAKVYQSYRSLSEGEVRNERS